MTLRATLITALESAAAGLGSPKVWSDDAPNSPDYPHMVLRMDPNASNMLNGDSRVLARNRSVSLSWYDKGGEGGTEDETKPLALVNAIDGYHGAGFKIRVLGWRRVADQSFPVIQWDFDLNAVFWGPLV